MRIVPIVLCVCECEKLGFLLEEKVLFENTVPGICLDLEEMR
jgi:hypothetical protein